MAISAHVASAQDRELPRGDGQMAPGGTRVERTHLVAGQRAAELGAERRRSLAVMM